MTQDTGLDDGAVDVDHVLDNAEPSAYPALDGLDNVQAGEAAASYSASFEPSDLVGVVNDQLQSDFGDYLAEDARPLDASTVEIKAGSEFESNGTYGYYDWHDTGTLVVNQDAGGVVETLVHEGLHLAADNGETNSPDGELVHHLGIEQVWMNPDSRDVLAVSNLNLNEGITEMFTRQSAENMGMGEISIAYPAEVQVAESLSSLVGDEVLKQAYFSSDVDGLRGAVDAELGQGAFDSISALMDAGLPQAAQVIIEGGGLTDQEN